MYVYMQVYVHLGMHMYASACRYIRGGGQRSALDIILQEPSTLFFKAGSFIGLELTH